MRGKVCLGLCYFFFHPPHPTWVLPTKLLKSVSHEWIAPKKLLSGCSHKDGHLYSISVVFCERQRKIYVPCKLELSLEKDIEKKYRSAVSLHKSDKGCDIINTCTHPLSLMLFFILISDLKGSFLSFYLLEGFSLYCSYKYTKTEITMKQYIYWC